MGSAVKRCLRVIVNAIGGVLIAALLLVVWLDKALRR